MASLRQLAAQHIQQGDRDGAIEHSKEILVLDPTQDFDPLDEARELEQESLLSRGRELALDGDYPGALTVLADLQVRCDALETDLYFELLGLLCEIAALHSGENPFE